jgi:hypothetical protein
VTTSAEVRRLYNSTQWRRLRLVILERDEYLCRIEPQPPHAATTVDHIVSPLVHPGGFFDPDNLRAACAHHNYGRGASQGHRDRAAAYRREREGATATSRHPSRPW